MKLCHCAPAAVVDFALCAPRSVLKGASCASGYSSAVQLCLQVRKTKPYCPYIHLNVHLYTVKQTSLQHKNTHTLRTTGFRCNDKHCSPTADCRSDDLPFHITLQGCEGHKHDIAPNHTDGEADTDVDVD